MHRYTDRTPCPSGPETGIARRGHRVSFASDVRNAYAPAAFSAGDIDCTENITFTTEFRPTLRDVKPRRRPTAMGTQRRESAFNPELDIWSELGRDEGIVDRRASQAYRRPGIAPAASSIAPTGVLTDPRRVRRSSTVFGQHPTEFGASNQLSARNRDMQLQQSHTASLTARLPEPKRSRRLSSLLEGQMRSFEPHAPNIEPSLRTSVQPRRRESILQKDPRRRTIFIPSDDTTIMTIHPGHYDRRRREKSPDLGFDLVTLSEEETENVSLNVPHMAGIDSRPRGPRKSLAVKPRRVPLQPSAHGEANVNEVQDMMGHGDGKENIPPGTRPEKGKTLHLDVRSGPADIVIHFDDSVPLTKNHHHHHVKRDVLREGRRESSVRPSLASTKKRNGSDSLRSAEPAKSVKMRHSMLPVDQPERASTLADLKLAAFKQSARTAGKLPLYYPVITEDVVNTELYEDHWLGHQEVALSQLLNHLLDTAEAGTPDSKLDHEKLRRGLLSLYQNKEFVLAHKRLKASLEFGALAISREMIAQVSRLSNDIGLRRRFIDLWLDAYDHSMLKAALETVVGREVVLPKRLSGSVDGQTEKEYEARKLRRGLERFIETFLIRHSDAQPDQKKTDASSISTVARTMGSHQPGQHSQTWIWRRTMLRSLMLILLLDRAKTTGTVHGCLFQRASERKSSVAVIHALASMLFPSLGDVIRPLTHLDYRVACVQYPLEEYQYKVDNLATDLRDGILLARVVELLLFSTRARKQVVGEETVTITIPSGEMLQSFLTSESQETWTLSQHLKLPCISRAQRLFNVQISLSALQHAKHGLGPAIDGITSENVVDGHREKTMCLLWAIVGKFGLGWLVDWRALKVETEILQRSSKAPNHQDSSLDDDSISLGFSDDFGEADYEKLLLSWVRAIAGRRGLDVVNLTTSFADNRALEAVADQYVEYFPAALCASRSSIISPSTPKATISAKLRQIGCSATFVSLFAPRSSDQAGNGPPSIPSKSFTVITLAYLASRLVPQTAAHRAATRIQTWYRKGLARRTLSRRVALLRVATDCATVVNTRARVINATCVLQRAWKSVLDRRLDRLVRDVVIIQSSVRGWATRLKVDGARPRRRGNGW